VFVKRVSWLVFAASLIAVVAGVVYAAVTSIPNSALVSSTTYYTDQIGGGIGSSSIMTRNDDNSSAVQNLGFTLNFFGTNYTQFYVNNNGNITFSGPLGSYTPAGPTGAALPIISPFFADVDTENAASGLVYLRTDIPNEIIVTWDQTGYYSSHADKLDSFQLVLRGPGFTVPSGEGQIGFFYKTMQWETGDASGGTGGFGGTPAAVGFGDGAGNGSTLQGSLSNGISGIVNNHHIWFNLSGGVPVTTGPPPVTGVQAPSSIGLIALGLAGVGLSQWLRQRKQQA